MKRALALAALLALAAPTHALETEVEFTLPAQMNGVIDATGAQVLSLRAEPSVADHLRLESESVTWTTATGAGFLSTNGIVGGGWAPTEQETTTPREHADVRLEARPSMEYGIQILLEDGSSLMQGEGQLKVPGQTGPGRSDPIPEPYHRDPYIRPTGLPEDLELAFLQDGAQTWTIQGDFRLELFGWKGSLDHAEGTEPMENGHRTYQSSDAADTYAYDRDILLVRQGTLTVHADHAWSAFTAPVADVVLNGTLALPLVEAPDPLQDEVDASGTWTYRGLASMQALRPGEENGHAAARASVDGQTLNIDGRPFLSSSLATSIASTLTGAMILTLIAIKAQSAGLFALLTRLPPEKALENENRKKLYAYIKERPGATFREVLRGTEIPAGTARHHLTVLARSQVIVERSHRSTLRFFENHGKFDQDWESIVFLREPELRQVHDWLAHQDEPIQKDLLEHAEAEWGWSRSTTQHRLLRLVEGGLVEVQPQGRRKIYRVT